MSESSYSLERDLKEAQDMVNALDTYVRGDKLYGSVGGFFSRTPSLTIGAVLLRLRRLRALADRLTPEQQSQLETQEARHDTIRREWSLHYGEKMIREAHARLDAMRAFFDECAQEPRVCAGIYPPEALRRTIVQELLPAIEAAQVDDGKLEAKVRQTDARLRRFAQPDSFVWAQELEPVYPREVFWWLYARPPAAAKS